MSAKETKGHAQHVAFVLQFGWNNKRQAFNSLAPIVRIRLELFCCSHRDTPLLMFFAPYGSDLSIIRVSRADRLCNRFVNPLKPTQLLCVSFV
jgi:hypothetical protein